MFPFHHITTLLCRSSPLIVHWIWFHFQLSQSSSKSQLLLIPFDSFRKHPRSIKHKLSSTWAVPSWFAFLVKIRSTTICFTLKVRELTDAFPMAPTTLYTNSRKRLLVQCCYLPKKNPPNSHETSNIGCRLQANILYFFNICSSDVFPSAFQCTNSRRISIHVHSAVHIFR